MLARFEGRLFVYEDRLCMVIESDETAGVARVSSRIDGAQTVREMPLAEIAELLAGTEKLCLDGIGTDSSKTRVVQKSDGWFFKAREGLKGPFSSGAEAEEELGRYMVAAQA